VQSPDQTAVVPSLGLRLKQTTICTGPRVEEHAHPNRLAGPLVGCPHVAIGRGQIQAQVHAAKALSCICLALPATVRLVLLQQMTFAGPCSMDRVSTVRPTPKRKAKVGSWSELGRLHVHRGTC